MEGEGGKAAFVLQGRCHPYEGYSYWQCCYYVWVLKALGVELLILSNAAGGLDPSLKTGQIVLIKDHISIPSLDGGNPLYALNDERLCAERFVVTGGMYDVALRRRVRQCARSLGLKDTQDGKGKGKGKGLSGEAKGLSGGGDGDADITEGVYSCIAGPSYATQAECRMFRQWGADLIGMSTTFEATVARAIGMRIVAFSVVTDTVPLDIDDSSDGDGDGDGDEPAVTVKAETAKEGAASSVSSAVRAEAAAGADKVDGKAAQGEHGPEGEGEFGHSEVLKQGAKQVDKVFKLLSAFILDYSSSSSSSYSS